MAGYTLHTISREKRGPSYAPQIEVTTIVRSTSDILPEGAISLAGLRVAEERRAADARSLYGTGLAATLLMRAGDLEPQTELHELLRPLESGAVVWEPTPQADQQPNGDAAHFARGQ